MSKLEVPSQAQQNTLLSTNQAAALILGGVDTDGYWGFMFQDFVSKLSDQMAKKIGKPTNAPWRNVIDFTPEDYLELRDVVESIDYCKDPVNHLDAPMVDAFLRRCDIVGMHGGINSIGVGKDTAAQALFKDGFKLMSFADVLKASLSMAYGIPLRYMVDRKLKESPLPVAQGAASSDLTPRRLMQLWGTEVVRAVNNDVWIKRHKLRVASAMHALSSIAQTSPSSITQLNGVRVAVPDVRFDDEAAYVRDAGGFVAWITRPGFANASLSNAHRSEAGISRYPTDLHLVNEGTVEDFQRSAREQIMARFAPPEAVQQRRLSSRPIR